jgi:hypothetical protein
MLLPSERGERKLVKVTAAHDYDDVHQLLDRLTPDQLGEIRAHALRLVACGPRRFVAWDEVQRGATKLPSMDYARFRAEVDAVVDQDFLLGDGR